MIKCTVLPLFPPLQNFPPSILGHGILSTYEIKKNALIPSLTIFICANFTNFTKFHPHNQPRSF